MRLVVVLLKPHPASIDLSEENKPSTEGHGVQYLRMVGNQGGGEAEREKVKAKEIKEEREIQYMST